MATQVSFPPQSRSPVHCKGEPLDTTLWQGVQWAVTAYGIERRDGKYAISIKNFLTNTWGGQKAEHCWRQHMGEKGWCDMDDFDDCMEAFQLLFDQKGNRTGVQAPFIEDEAAAREEAMRVGDAAYQRALKDMGL